MRNVVRASPNFVREDISEIGVIVVITINDITLSSGIFMFLGQGGIFNTRQFLIYNKNFFLSHQFYCEPTAFLFFR